MEIVIVSKTRMSADICIGGLVLENNRYVRLLNPGNKNQPTDTKFEVGDIWDIKSFKRKGMLPPHIEDVIILEKRIVRRINAMPVFLRERNTIDWHGHIDDLFDAKIKWTDNGSGFINKENVPKQSVGFWIADKDLTKNEFNGFRYNYPNAEEPRSLKFVGFDTPINVIPEGTILRVSEAR